MPRKSPYAIILAEEEARELDAIARRYTSPYCDVMRAKVVLLAADGCSNKEPFQSASLRNRLAVPIPPSKKSWTSFNYGDASFGV